MCCLSYSEYAVHDWCFVYTLRHVCCVVFLVINSVIESQVVVPIYCPSLDHVLCCGRKCPPMYSSPVVERSATIFSSFVFPSIAYPACDDQPDKQLFPNCVPLLQPIYAHVENCYYNTLPGYSNGWIIMDFSDKKTP